ncbi:MAG: thioredoxin family protein [Deltaproteobacteria bacterium]|nr:thioredoxin family protein [Deltaproteobacteria bacterium]
MKYTFTSIFSALAVGALMLGSAQVFAAGARVGTTAPAFSATDITGKTHKLADFKGKYVVLEWFNHGCPFVQKHYGSKNMQTLQKKWTGKGVVWLSINSGAKGKEGFEDAAATSKTAQAKGTASTAIFVDEAGTLGRLYGASATPHMFVIDPAGKVIYAGAIDSVASTEQEDLAKAENYVEAALSAALAGKPVKVKEAPPYGCGVKYK